MISLGDALVFLVTNAENGSADDCEEYYFPAHTQPRVNLDVKKLTQQHLTTQSRL